MKNRAFTKMEILMATAIIAFLAASITPIISNFVTQAREVASQRSLDVLNEALNSYKTLGGDLTALTSGKAVDHLLDALKEPVVKNGLTRTFLLASFTIPDTVALAATGEGAFYKLTQYGDYEAESGGSVLSHHSPPPYVYEEDFEGVGVPDASWVWNDVGTASYDHSTNSPSGGEALFTRDNSNSESAGPYRVLDDSYDELWIYCQVYFGNVGGINRSWWVTNGVRFYFSTSGGRLAYSAYNSVLGRYTWYHVWVHVYPTGVDGYVSQDGVKPSTPQFHSGGSFGPFNYFGAGRPHGSELKIDHVKIAETEIWDNP